MSLQRRRLRIQWCRMLTVHLIVTACHKALTPFTFSDGLRVDRGDWVCIPQRATMLDPPRYRHIQQVDRFRFVRANKSLAMGDGSVDVPEVAPLPLTDVHVNWPYGLWGLQPVLAGSTQLRSTVSKMMMVCILQG
ncbi:hypothetical protein ASPBRDRAFT_417382 [Aspergillus brasiliensis CBS 101740]|uniref:Secreted protein n=1 Tax=Aspergillus brasiliensis (strain CBS 101740 / IMI 381727 / IBT 21946) TaxID=767769 RepID=A0A1L9UYJ7_ASPBC|nr:hypothetical protein ASPBRDRAFT_417382 [Aspergillus brasiliensis CBS 101740]